jgi:hypothetical protein
MVTPGFLQSPNVIRWFGSIEPAWTLLTVESFNALRHEPSKERRALVLASDLTDTEISLSPIARNMLLFLQRASVGEGLKLTGAGNLSRAVVAEMVDLFEWPEFDRAEAHRYHKLLNEPDFLPLYFVRHIATQAKLVRPYRGFLRPTQLGRDLPSEARRRALQSILFHVTFWHADLSYFGRSMFGTWPQSDAGVLFWSLSVSASNWQMPETLSRLCSIPIIGVLESTWDTGSMLVEARILRPLLWFGLLEHRSEAIQGNLLGQRHFYRKSKLFDRFFAFNVEFERTSSTGQH